MRPRLIALLLALGLVAAACSSDGASVAADDTVTSEPDATFDDGDFPDGPSALRDSPTADGLPEPLVDPDEIFSGGPPPDGIPSIDEPVYQSIESVDVLDDNEPVLLLELDGEARIFPVEIMIWHELVNDVIGDIPVTMSYCPLCNSAIAYDRRVDGGVLDFGTSGSLYRSAMVMYDRQTESLWSHYNGEAIAGVLTGTQLEFFPLSTLSWADARAAAPEALVLSRDTGHSRDYGRNPYVGYDDVNTAPFLFRDESDPRLRAKERIIGIEGETEAVAVRTEELALHDVIDVTLDGRDVTVWRKPGTASALDAAGISAGRDVGATGVFDRELDGRILTFSTGDDGTFVDDETGSTWDITGEAIDGELAGARLDQLVHLDTFWFAWAAFLPDTTVAN